MYRFTSLYKFLFVLGDTFTYCSDLGGWGSAQLQSPLLLSLFDLSYGYLVHTFMFGTDIVPTNLPLTYDVQRDGHMFGNKQVAHIC